MTRLVLGFLALALLSGCGIRGDLQRPGPMWGDPPPAGQEDDETARRSTNPRVEAPPAPPRGPGLPGGPPPGPPPTNAQ